MLTERVIRDAKATGKTFTVWDSKMPGFGLQVTAGGTKNYIVRYRAAGRKRQAILARAGGVSLADIRKRAAAGLLKVRADGTDPLQRQHDAKQAPTVKDLVERFLNDTAPARIGDVPGVRPSVRHTGLIRSEPGSRVATRSVFGDRGRRMLTTQLRRIASVGRCACLVAALSLSGPAQAVCISQTVGNTTIHNCDGKISVSQTVGAITVHNIDGKIGVSQTVGRTTVHNFDGKVGTSQTVGATTVHNFDGRFGVSQRIGGITAHTGQLFTGR